MTAKKLADSVAGRQKAKQVTTACRYKQLRLTTRSWIDEAKSTIGVALSRVDLVTRIHRAIEREAAVFVPRTAAHPFKRRKFSVVCPTTGDVDADSHAAAAIVHWHGPISSVVTRAVAVALQVRAVPLTGATNDQVWRERVMADPRAARTTTVRCVERGPIERTCSVQYLTTIPSESHEHID